MGSRCETGDPTTVCVVLMEPEWGKVFRP